MNLYSHKPKNETDDFLILITKITNTPVAQTKTNKQETLEFKTTEPQILFS